MESLTENCTALCKSCLTGTLQTKNKDFVNGIREMTTNSSSEKFPETGIYVSIDSGLIVVILIIWILVLVFGYREINELMDFRGDIQLNIGSDILSSIKIFALGRNL